MYLRPIHTNIEIYTHRDEREITSTKNRRRIPRKMGFFFTNRRTILYITNKYSLCIAFDIEREERGEGGVCREREAERGAVEEIREKRYRVRKNE